MPDSRDPSGSRERPAEDTSPNPERPEAGAPPKRRVLFDPLLLRRGERALARRYALEITVLTVIVIVGVYNAPVFWQGGGIFFPPWVGRSWMDVASRQTGIENADAQRLADLYRRDADAAFGSGNSDIRFYAYCDQCASSEITPSTGLAWVKAPSSDQPLLTLPPFGVPADEVTRAVYDSTTYDCAAPALISAAWLPEGSPNMMCSWSSGGREWVLFAQSYPEAPARFADDVRLIRLERARVASVFWAMAAVVAAAAGAYVAWYWAWCRHVWSREGEPAE